MAKDKKQGEQPKPQSDQGESQKSSNGPGQDRCSEEIVQRDKKGTAGDGTNSTGPRKKE